jgi:hypothetical protein
MTTVLKGPTSGKITDLSIVSPADEPLDPLDAAGESGAPLPGAPHPPEPQSHVLVRDDGVVLVSLEEAHDRDLTGREIVQCLVLNAGELSTLRGPVSNGFAVGAAQIIGALPRRGS